MWHVIELKVLSPIICVSPPVPFDEALINALLLTQEVKSWEEGHRLLPIKRLSGIPLISVPFPLSAVHEGMEMITRRGAGELMYEMGEIKKKLPAGTGALKNYQRFYRAVYTERLAVFVSVEEGKEEEMERILDLPLWIGKKGKMGFGKLEVEGFYEAEGEVSERFEVQGRRIRPLPITSLPLESPNSVVLHFRRRSPYWRMDEREAMETNVPDSFEVVLDEEA